MPNVLSPRDLVFRPDNMEETVPHIISNVGFEHRTLVLIVPVPVHS